MRDYEDDYQGRTAKITFEKLSRQRPFSRYSEFPIKYYLYGSYHKFGEIKSCNESLYRVWISTVSRTTKILMKYDYFESSMDRKNNIRLSMREMECWI